MTDHAAPSFDRIARPYRWLEYFTLGRALEGCRLYFLPRVRGARHALLLGDGDGRFLAALFAANPVLSADAVDTSPTMLGLLRRRVHTTSSTAAARLQTHCSDALLFTPAQPCDLIVTHFFLDCLTQSQLDLLCARLVPALQPNGLWLVSDFHIPSGPLRWPARGMVRALYLAFRILTGLRVTSLPDHRAAMQAAGLIRIAHHSSLAGLLIAELWQRAE